MKITTLYASNSLAHLSRTSVLPSFSSCIIISHYCKTLCGLIWDGFFYYQREVWICFLSLVARPPTSYTWAFSVCFLVLYGELIPLSSGFKTSWWPPEIHPLLNCLSLATLHPLASGAFCLSIVTAVYFSRVGQPLQNILKPLIAFAKLN